MRLQEFPGVEFGSARDAVAALRAVHVDPVYAALIVARAHNGAEARRWASERVYVPAAASLHRVSFAEAARRYEARAATFNARAAGRACAGSRPARGPSSSRRAARASSRAAAAPPRALAPRPRPSSAEARRAPGLRA
jgi:hypothetical protein